MTEEGRDWRKVAQERLDYIHRLEKELRKAWQEVDRLSVLINTPETEDWMKAVPLEAAHQSERWSEDDPEKTSLDWFWLIGYLAQKATFSQISGDFEKAKHHTISTAAALLNWHRRMQRVDQLEEQK